jgi:hypothetical protein
MENKELLEKIIELVKSTPNDMELGAAIRVEINKLS